MQTSNAILFLGILLSLLHFGSCKTDTVSLPDDDEPIPERNLDFIDTAEFNGTWEGALTQQPVGSCPIDYKNLGYQMDVKVTEDGQIRISDEYYIYPGNLLVNVVGSSWSGQIHVDSTVELTRIRKFICWGAERYDTFDYSAILELKADSLLFSARQVETWCPVQDCRFDTELFMYRLR